MLAFWKILLGLALLLPVGVPLLVNAQEDDLFAFIPPGGRTLLGELIASGKVSTDQIISSRRSREEWLGFIRSLGEIELDPNQQETLADYLAGTMPVAESAGQTIDTHGVALPRDGRDLALEFCQSCHIITVVVTQDRTRDAWLGTMNKPSHVEIDTTPAEREALADYLVRNAGIPIEDVPEELRAGGATY